MSCSRISGAFARLSYGLGLLIVLGTFTIEACAAPPKRVDLSTMTEASGTYEVGFCARPSPNPVGWPGHLFVSFSHKDSAGAHDFTAIGHTVSAGTSPTAAGWSLFGTPVSGRLKGENYTSVLQDCLIVKINKDDFGRVYALTQSPLARLGIARGSDIVFQQYTLGDEDCVGFAIDVAKVVEPRGLKVPRREPLERPIEYLRRFIAAN